MSNNESIDSQDPAERWLGRRFLGQSSGAMLRGSLTRQLKQRLEDWATEVVSQSGQSRPPMDLERLIRMLEGIRVSIRREPTGTSHYGELTPVAGGFRVTIDPTTGRVRERFALAHEIGHMLFFDWDPPIPRQSFRSSRYWVQEGYANEIARMLLVPRQVIAIEIESRQIAPSLSSFLEFCHLFEVSTDVMRRRLISDLQLWDCMIFSSHMTGEHIVTNPSGTSRGQSFARLSIPRTLGNDAWSTALRECIVSASPGRLSVRFVSQAGKRLIVETCRGTGQAEARVTAMVRENPSQEDGAGISGPASARTVEAQAGNAGPSQPR